jgi:hypothetical protein
MMFKFMTVEVDNGEIYISRKEDYISTTKYILVYFDWMYLIKFIVIN